MPSKTPSGLPYPLPTEPVRDGAANIQALTAALDVRVQSGSSIIATTAGSGDGYVPYPIAFKAGSKPTFLPVISDPPAGYQVSSYWQYTDNSRAAVKIQTAAGALPGAGSYRIEWAAIGYVT